MKNIRTLLIQKYKSAKLTNKEDCLKLSYQYHTIKVHIYFDFYNGDIANLYLALEFEKSYYYTTLNIDNLAIKNPYLKDIPIQILSQISEKKSLKDFYDKMREYISNDKFEVKNYYDDTFKNAIKSNTNTNKHPFLSHLRKANMSNEQLNFLYTHFNISKYILKDIQKAGFTIITTSKIKERKDLTIMLKEKSIKI